MTEQEQIKGITRLLEETHGICGNFSGCTNRKCSQCYAEAIYNAGYRKADEVRKKTAEKIFNKIKIKVLTEDMTEDRPQTLYRFTSFDIMKMAREIVEEFGVVFANGHATVEIKE